MSILQSINYAVVQAMTQHLPDVEFAIRDRTEKRRPYEGDCEVVSFSQSWGSTALGFGGIGGQAITSAQTTVVMTPWAAAVYFGPRLAYVVSDPNQQFFNDIAAQNMHEVRGAATRYARQPKDGQ